MTRDPYTEHMDEMLRLGGAHECASDCPMPLPRRRPDSRASAPEQGEAPADLMRRALETIRRDEGKVCEQYESCIHLACSSSYSAWAIADATLRSVERAASGAQAVLPLDVERLAGALNAVERKTDLGWPDMHERDFAAVLASEYAALHPEDGPQKHATWCWLPADHQGLCEGDQ